MARPSPATPRWTVLLALAVGVLAAHLLLLTGGVRWDWPAAGPDAPAALQPAALTTARDTDAPSQAPPPEPTVAVQVSTVRWIAPPSPPPAPAPANPAPAVLKEIQVVGPQPVPEDDGEQATPPTQLPIDTPSPTATPAMPVPEPAPVAETPHQPQPAVANATPAPAKVEDTLVAAAGNAAPRNPATEPHPLPPAQLPASVRLGYDIQGKAKGLGYSADAQLQWLVEGQRYTAELEISAFLVGSRVQTSQGSIGPHGLSPLRFGDRRRGAEKAAHFDHARQTIRFSNNAPDVPLQPGAQDRLSVFLQLGALLQARPQAYPEGASIAVQVASTGGAEVWQFQVGALQALTLPAGTVPARRLLREPRREYDSTVEVWLAPSLQHLPVRIRVTEQDGSLADQLLRQLPPLLPLPTDATQ
ncbi:MAG: DUF3108 domain-containing protein [Hydrogenophaga sp.]|uniref:DUF3108 domain-containing protein n=1 Tax=Hydrogenophaga sp. TaxID=1904254 RepID=UPI003D9AF32B